MSTLRLHVRHNRKHSVVAELQLVDGVFEIVGIIPRQGLPPTGLRGKRASLFEMRALIRSAMKDTVH